MSGIETSVSRMSASIPDAPPPTWEQLEKGLVAVKTVVHGLVDFIQNHSKKGADPQQVNLSKHFTIAVNIDHLSVSKGALTSHVHMMSPASSTQQVQNIHVS